ncbi:hypothetical protein LCGC14_2233040 [marine sediment metagenome]|uniref:Uncharacterized protein n=1 Tax=marine sediment metagenome TaxID=412755 RepID=A0A0F9FK60_9ZZZZ
MDDLINQVKHLLDRISDYNHIIHADNFQAPTVEDIKDNAKAISDEIKFKVDDIKSLINQWE